MDTVLSPGDFDVASLRERILRYQPRILAFNGRRAAAEFLGRKAVSVGMMSKMIGETIIFVLPSTSGAAGGYWDEAPWREIAALTAGFTVTPPSPGTRLIGLCTGRLPGSFAVRSPH